MGLLEWLGESYNPGPVGSIGLADEEEPPGEWAAEDDLSAAPRKTKGQVVFRLCLALALVGLAGWLYLAGRPRALEHAVIAGTIFAAYCWLAFHLRPEPDASNLGWLGGLVDNPFRFSDDLNRLLLVLQIVLVPGRFVATSIIDGFRLFRSPLH